MPATSATTTIWLARHGEAHNPRAILYGRLPRIRLSASGHQQADALAHLLAERPLSAVYSSPLLRARATAAPIAARHHLTVRRDSDLVETSSGWEGQPFSALEGVEWDIYGQPRGPVGESLPGIRDRMRRWVRRVLGRHGGGEVVGVTHGDPVLVLLADLRGEPMTTSSIRVTPYIPTACVFELRFSPNATYLGGSMHVPYER